MRLMDDLHWLAARWVEEQGRAHMRSSLKTLGFRCVRDSKLFDRLAAGRPIAVPTYQNIIDYLAAPTSWPRDMPADVGSRLALLGVEVPGFVVFIDREVVERQIVVRA